ncbi:uncharacterized protein LOC126890077 [Diabrotica virgifera virgifera]|uniref:Integrase catalytic domain-containing protein n=1 Tax=Diabrotica virgifera virgifera TaxID=50390 RepID=A0ABM5KXE8_DIAVI|nr:uncharacterized protein LOC126890077 [Diabrotica virgifera virgifera]
MLIRLLLQIKRMSRAQKLVEAALKENNENYLILTEESIEDMPVILFADSTSTYDNLTGNIMEIEPLASGTSEAATEVFINIEPLDIIPPISNADTQEIMNVARLDNDSPVSLKSVSEECLAPVTMYHCTAQEDNNTNLIDKYFSDDSDCMNAKLVPYSEHSDSDSEEEPRRIKRRKRCQVKKATWKDQMNKLHRENGQQYTGRKKIEGKWERIQKNKRVLKPRCKCRTTDKSALKCSEVSEEERKNIFEMFWRMNWGEKKVFVNGLVQEIPTKRPRDRKDPLLTRRQSTMVFNLNLTNDCRVRVCKTMFQNTLCLTKMTIWNWKKGKENISQKTNRHATKNPHEVEVKSLQEFLNNIPKMESHYCRKSWAKLYLLPEWTSKKALYNFYTLDWCTPRNITPLSIAKFSNTLEIENISLFKPKKDQCEKCLSHKLGNIPDTEHKEHIERKNEARLEKEQDKNKEEFVFTMDTQAVLLAPKSNVSSLYYKTKICTHNFCIFNIKNKDGFCYLWNETEGGLSSDNYATIIVKFITEKLLPSIHREPGQDTKIILYSDGCTAQNRNVILANALLNVATLNNVTIQQKYLEVGHTQMEADSMHATIERKLKNKIIHIPAEYAEVCVGARKNPKPYNVSYLTHEFFKSFASLQFYKSIRPGKAIGDAKVTDIRALQYKQGNLYFKLRFTDEWQLLPQRCDKRVSVKPIESLPNLHENQLKISSRKFKDLQQLKSTLPVDYRDYYDNVPHEDS